MSFFRLLHIAKAIQQILVNRDMPVWTKNDPELFNIASKFNDLQLKALTELTFDSFSKIKLFEAVTILRTILLILEKSSNSQYATNMQYFKTLVMETLKQQFNLIYETNFISIAKELIINSSFFDDNISTKTQVTLFEKFFEECKKAKPSEDNIVLFDQEGIDFTSQDLQGKTGLHYICEQKESNLNLVIFFLNKKCELSIVIPYAVKLMSQALKQNNHTFILLLLLLSLQEEVLVKKISDFGRAQGNLIEKFIYFFVSIDMLTKFHVVKAISELLNNDIEADKIMEILLDQYALELEKMIRNDKFASDVIDEPKIELISQNKYKHNFANETIFFEITSEMLESSEEKKEKGKDLQPVDVPPKNPNQQVRRGESVLVGQSVFQSVATKTPETKKSTDNSCTIF